MTIVKKDQKLLFPFETEYTIDGGTTWTALAANTEVIIPSDDLDAGGRKITIRSTDVNATTMVGADFGKDDVRFDEVNIRNAKVMTTMTDTFDRAVINRLHINNVPELVDATHLCRSAVINEVIIGEMPKLEIGYLFQLGAYGYIGKIRMGRLSTTNGCQGRLILHKASCGVFAGQELLNATDGFSSSLREASIEAVGDMSCVRHPSVAPVATEASYMMDTTIIDYIPSVSINSGIASIENHNTQNMIYNLNKNRKSYIPSVSFEYRRSTGSSYPSSHMLYGASGKLMFGGVSISVGSQNDDSLISATAVGNAKKLVSSLNASHGNSLPNDLQAELNVKSGQRFFYNNTNWFPHVDVMDVDSNSSYIGTVSAGPRHLNYLTAKTTANGIDVFSGKKYKAPRFIQSSDTREYEIANANNIVFCRNGYLAYNLGADIKVVNSDMTELCTIAGKQIIKGQFSADGLKFYIVLGGEIDKSGTNGQQVVNTVEVYNTQTGAKIGDTITVPLGTDEWVAGVYQKDDNYGLKIIKNVWSVEKDADDNDLPYAFKEVRIDSYEPSGTTSLRKTMVSGSGECTYVMQDFFESNECAIVNAVAGTVQRIVGK